MYLFFLLGCPQFAVGWYELGLLEIPACPEPAPPRDLTWVLCVTTAKTLRSRHGYFRFHWLMTGSAKQWLIRGRGKQGLRASWQRYLVVSLMGFGETSPCLVFS